MAAQRRCCLSNGFTCTAEGVSGPKMQHRRLGIKRPPVWVCVWCLLPESRTPRTKQPTSLNTLISMKSLSKSSIWVGWPRAPRGFHHPVLAPDTTVVGSENIASFFEANSRLLDWNGAAYDAGQAAGRAAGGRTAAGGGRVIFQKTGCGLVSDVLRRGSVVYQRTHS